MAKAPSKFAGGLNKKKKPTGGDAGGAKAPRAPQTRAGGHKKIGQVLIDLGLITEEQLWQILEHHKQSGERTGRAAVSLQLITEEMLVQALAEQQGMRTVDVKGQDFKISDKAKEIVSETMCQLYKVIPWKVEGNVLTVVMADPTNLAALDDMRNMLAVEEIQAVVAAEADVLGMIDKSYAGQQDSIEDIIKGMEDVEDRWRPAGGPAPSTWKASKSSPTPLRCASSSTWSSCWPFATRRPTFTSNRSRTNSRCAIAATA
jgi:hypothetical protein